MDKLFQKMNLVLKKVDFYMMKLQIKKFNSLIEKKRNQKIAAN